MQSDVIRGRSLPEDPVVPVVVGHLGRLGTAADLACEAESVLLPSESRASDLHSHRLAVLLVVLLVLEEVRQHLDRRGMEAALLEMPQVCWQANTRHSSASLLGGLRGKMEGHTYTHLEGCTSVEIAARLEDWIKVLDVKC